MSIISYPAGKIEANKRYHFEGSFKRIWEGGYKDIDYWYFISNGFLYQLPSSISPILNNLFNKYICGKRVPTVFSGFIYFGAYTYCCMYNGKQEDVNLYLVTYEEEEFEKDGKKIKYIPLNLEIEINGNSTNCMSNSTNCMSNSTNCMSNSTNCMSKKGFILLNGVYFMNSNDKIDFKGFYRKYKSGKEYIYGISDDGKYYFINNESNKNKIKRSMNFIEDLPCNKNLDKLIDFNLISKYNIDDIKMEIVEE